MRVEILNLNNNYVIHMIDNLTQITHENKISLPNEHYHNHAILCIHFLFSFFLHRANSVNFEA
jgi:hypothetical protein